MIPTGRWEYGSEFHWPTTEEIGPLLGSHSFAGGAERALFYGSGRGALADVLKHGRVRRGWRRVLVPTYLCPALLLPIESLGLEISQYADHPLKTPAGLPEGRVSRRDVVLRLNYFGWRGAESIISSSELGCEIIEDHTHDPLGPWARGSRAEFCFASLRKTCPIPDGAALWSPRGIELPEPPAASKRHYSACAMKLAGMVLKQVYLLGGNVRKEHFRHYLVAGEVGFERAEISAMHPVSRGIVAAIAQDRLRNRRLRNFEMFYKLNAIRDDHWATPALPKDVAPFSIVLLLEDKMTRDSVKEKLIRRRVFPAVLWTSASEVDEAGKEFSARMLSLPCDFRYDEKDLSRLGEILEAALYGGCGR
jgi:hypothetical protein